MVSDNRRHLLHIWQHSNQAGEGGLKFNIAIDTVCVHFSATFTPDHRLERRNAKRYLEGDSRALSRLFRNEQTFFLNSSCRLELRVPGPLRITRLSLVHQIVATLDLASKTPPVMTRKAKRHASTQVEKMNEAG
jgi:hypothetical protein